ncbi:hypothetical protein EDF88_5011 [Buttiauxella sp. BIGb0552]|uniref:hypothetical protein n=1 Tax=Buttiauxella sp. BIGb0552 TaxID=2485120 RepID=UPI001066AFD5|nr:hypothetical protein [Buttiauxella sp. BIGb0552]TDX09596.1 hypothetical protein EDF88_5011 [Buttiauxella sp. BIGb0552]
MSNNLKLIAQMQSVLPNVPRQQIIEMLGEYQRQQAQHAPMMPHIVPMHKSIAEGLDLEPKESPTAGLHRERFFQNEIEKCLGDAMAKGLSTIQASDLRAQAHNLGKASDADHGRILSALKKHVAGLCQSASQEEF